MRFKKTIIIWYINFRHEHSTHMLHIYSFLALTIYFNCVIIDIREKRGVFRDENNWCKIKKAAYG